MSNELKPCPFCGTLPARYGRGLGQMVVCEHCDYKIHGFSTAWWNTRHITRADIPEAMVREIQADTLGEAALHFAEYNVAGGTLSSPQWLLKRSSELREQKDETV